MWFLRGREAGIRATYYRYNPQYVEVFGQEDYGEAMLILRRPIEC
jgi:hypothetical protein